MKILVLGAGVIGTTSAYFLARAGHEVIVVERHPGPGLETSFANGGQLSAAHARPWANPTAPWDILRWIGKADAPLVFHPRADIKLWSWGLRFLVNCSPGRTRANTERNMRLALYNRGVMDELVAETGIDFNRTRNGILQIHRHERTLAAASRHAEFLRGLGCEVDVLGAPGCIEVEPALAPVRDSLAGGIFSPGDSSGDAHLFTQRLAAIAAAMGVVFRYDTTVKRLSASGGRITGVMTDMGMYVANAYVVAMASYSPWLIRPLGLKLPVTPAKGYSVTLPVEGTGAPLVSITDEAHKLVFSRLGDQLRIAGTAELGSHDATIDNARAEAILENALDLFPGAGDGTLAQFWAGLRPLTPDGVPVIGATPMRNLYLNTGHGTLGWTLACASGRVIADQVTGAEPEIDTKGLGLARF